VRIKALSVFEGVIYHCALVDGSNPCQPTLEVEALLREGDADAGPLLLPVAEYAVMVGHEVARTCLGELDRTGRIIDHLGSPHLAFPMWTAGDITAS
jgi:hypothetical protein